VSKVTQLFYGSWLLLVVLACPLVARAQAVPQESRSVTTEPAASTFSPRFGLRYTTEGAGFAGFTSVEGFVPVFQNPGSNLTFAQGHLLLNNNSTIGGNLVLGRRFYNQMTNRYVGGYLAYDNRNTGKNTFNQLGLGFETVGDWEFRTNAYLPLGTSRAVSGATALTGNATFQGQGLQLERATPYEAAVSGVDAEFGGRIAKIGSGDLRGYAGLYYSAIAGGNTGIGWRTRIVARPTENIDLGLSVQNDPLFNTRALFSVGINFPGSGSTRSKVKSDDVLTQMAALVDRQVTIPVQTTNVLAAPTTALGVNIQHVVLGASATGNGNFETPYSTVASALTNASANDIIYVQSGTNPGIPAFTIKDGVSVLSSGPVQRIDTPQLANVLLPSGSGVSPAVTGTVTMGNNTTLAGFGITVPNGTGIVASNSSNFTVRDNTIAAAKGIDVSLSAANTGTANILNNSITPSATGLGINSTGISLRAIETSQLTANVQGNTINGTPTATEGIAFRSSDDAKGTITIANNTVSNIAGSGVVLQSGDRSIDQITVSGNTINGAKINGINNLVYGSSVMATTIVGNVISNTTGIGVESDVRDTGTLKLALKSNLINNSGSLGVSSNASDTSNLSVIAESNTLTNNNTVTGAQSPATPSAFDVAADPSSLGGTPQVCVRLDKNQGVGNLVADYSLYNGNLSGAIFRVENTFATNSGTITLQAYNQGTSALIPATAISGTIGSQALTAGFTSVVSGTCPTP
jgi:trimeric autotransporter adhesin